MLVETLMVYLYRNAVRFILKWHFYSVSDGMTTRRVSLFFNWAPTSFLK